MILLALATWAAATNVMQTAHDKERMSQTTLAGCGSSVPCEQTETRALSREI